jgi:3-deoxy-D-manno-octulosonate 8-phosphate phosphatase (KDO 8-P phosphatase)
MSGPRLDQQLARSIRLVGIDVDGVLTDGGIYLGADSTGGRVELKRYDIQDGLGIYLLRQAGIRVAIVTGRVSESVRLRAAELEIEDVAQDAQARKLPAFRRILKARDIPMAEAAFIGDDLPDVGILRVVGLPVAVANCVPEVAELCSVRLTRGGGRGAIREFSELLLKARGEWDKQYEAYVAARVGDDDSEAPSAKARLPKGRGVSGSSVRR